MDNRSKASVAAASLVGSLLLIATTSGAQPQGEVIVDGNQFMGKPGRGNYVRRAARGGAWK